MNHRGNTLSEKRILVVDDEPDIRRLINRVLSQQGYLVVEAEDGSECMETLKRGPAFIMVVLDIIMPNKEGLETIIEMRRHYPALKILAISGGGKQGMEMFLTTAKKFGASEILKKPFSHDELLQAVENVLEEGVIP